MELDTLGLDNFFRFGGRIYGPRFDKENKDVEDDEDEPVVPEGYRIKSL